MLYCVFGRVRNILKILEKNKWYSTYINKSYNHRILLLKPFFSKGLWSGENPFIIKKNIREIDQKKLLY